jgi:hypothetical protein
MGTERMSRRQYKKLDAARRVTDGGEDVLAYATGKGHARISKGLICLVVGFAALFVVLLAAVHVVLIPGVVLVVVAIGLIKPKRGVAVTPDAVLVFHESIWNGKPNRLVLSAPAAELSAANLASTGAPRASLVLGAERITLKTEEFERLLRAVERPIVEHPPT